jgi:putative N6-adenine-specific DNA methylase
MSSFNKAPQVPTAYTTADPDHSMQSRSDAVFGVIPPGLEQVLAEELEELGVGKTEIEPGGVSFRADRETLYHLHRWCRSANRFWVRLGRFPAANMEALARGIRTLAWSQYVHPRRQLTVRVSSSGSRLSHKESVASKVELAVRDALRGPRREGARPPRDPLEVLVRIEQDEVEVSVDASGDRLHRRGWRRDITHAPLRENLAAAVLWVSGWQPGEPLVDPMCGSGTFVIEAATIAAGKAPGDQREFAFQTWPSHDDRLWSKVRAGAGEAIPTQILGSDLDEDAISAARANARRAGVAVELSQSDIRELRLPAGPGTIVVNPPYGERLRGARESWKALGSWLQAHAQGWRVAVLSPDRELARLAGLSGPTAADFRNGGIHVGVYVQTIGAEQTPTKRG